MRGRISGGEHKTSSTNLDNHSRFSTYTLNLVFIGGKICIGIRPKR